MPRFRLALFLALLTVLTAAATAKVPESAFEKNPYPAEKGPVQVFILSGPVSYTHLRAHET